MECVECDADLSGRKVREVFRWGDDELPVCSYACWKSLSKRRGSPRRRDAARDQVLRSIEKRIITVMRCGGAYQQRGLRPFAETMPEIGDNDVGKTDKVLVEELFANYKAAGEVRDDPLAAGSAMLMKSVNGSIQNTREGRLTGTIAAARRKDEELEKRSEEQKRLDAIADLEAKQEATRLLKERIAAEEAARAEELKKLRGGN